MNDPMGLSVRSHLALQTYVNSPEIHFEADEVANRSHQFIIGLPFLFGITLIFTAVEYFLTNFDQRTDAFFKFLLWLFLDLVAAESLVVLVSAIFPVFVVALAGTAFANGLWMCVDGFLVPTDTLNPFWKFVWPFLLPDLRC